MVGYKSDKQPMSCDAQLVGTQTEREMAGGELSGGNVEGVNCPGKMSRGLFGDVWGIVQGNIGELSREIVCEEHP